MGSSPTSMTYMKQRFIVSLTIDVDYENESPDQPVTCDEIEWAVRDIMLLTDDGNFKVKSLPWGYCAIIAEEIPPLSET